MFQVHLFTLIILALQTKICTTANSVDPDEMAHYEPSHLDLHCLPFCSSLLTNYPACKNGHA